MLTHKYTHTHTGLGDRLAGDLDVRFAAFQKEWAAPPGTLELPKVAVLPSTKNREPGYTSQRKVAAWIGGSIFASLETYRDLRISRQEWEEGAEAAIFKKCF